MSHMNNDVSSPTGKPPISMSFRSKWSATEWFLTGHDIRVCRVTLRDGSFMFAVRNRLGDCLNRDGKWEHEPIPSERDDAFMARCRFYTWNEGMIAAEYAVAGNGGEG